MKKCIENLKLHVKLLTSEDEDILKTFDSGEFSFNEYLQTTSFEDKNSGDGVTYIIEDIISDKIRKVVAYFTISTANVNFKDQEDKNDIHYLPISAIMINMFAVNKEYQDAYHKGKLISAMILKYIIGEMHELSIGIIGAKAIILCSVKSAVDFYKKNGFSEMSENYTIFDKVDAMDEDNLPMLLPIHKHQLLQKAM